MPPARPLLPKISGVVICLFLAALTVIIFWPVRHFEFLGLDDHVYVSGNPHIRDGLTLNGLKWAFGADLFFQSENADYWQPLTFGSRMADFHFFGADAGAHHLMNLALHGANVILLFVILFRLTGSLYASAAVAVFFAIHPLGVEAVAWVSARKDVLSVFFALLAAQAWLVSFRRGTWWMAGVAAFIASLLSKPMMITLPILLMMADYVRLVNVKINRKGERFVDPFSFRVEAWRSFITKWPLWLVCLVYAPVPFLGQPRAFDYTVTHPVTRALLACGFYLGKILVPFNIALYGPVPEEAVAAGTPVAALAALLLISWCVFHPRLKFYPMIRLGWVWFAAGILPVAGLEWPADRFVYFPKVGILIMVVWGIAHLSERFAVNAPEKRAVLMGGFVAYAVFLGVVTARALPYWRDDITLMRRALDYDRRNYAAHNILGVALARAGDTDAALGHFEQAIALKPGRERAYNNIGMVFYNQNRLEEARTYFERALVLKGDDAELLVNLGNVHARWGDLDRAIGYYSRALALAPGKPGVLNNLALAFFQKGDSPRALAYFDRLLEMQPRSGETYYRVGLVHLSVGDRSRARRAFEQALTLNPGFAPARRQLEFLFP